MPPNPVTSFRYRVSIFIEQYDPENYENSTLFIGTVNDIADFPTLAEAQAFSDDLCG